MNNNDTVNQIIDKINNEKELDIDYLLKLPRELMTNYDIILNAVKKNIDYFYFISEEFRNDKNIIMTAISNNAYVFKTASKSLQNDKDVVLAAVTGENENLYSGLIYKTKTEMIHFSVNHVKEGILEDAKIIFDEINKETVQGLTELLSPLTQEEIDNQKRIYLEQ